MADLVRKCDDCLFEDVCKFKNVYDSFYRDICQKLDLYRKIMGRVETEKMEEMGLAIEIKCGKFMKGL